MAFSRKLCAKHNWPSIDVTRRSIEETAAAVIAAAGRAPPAAGVVTMPLWLADQPLVLASKSAVRRAVLEGAGIPLDVCPADIDERGIETRAGTADAGRDRDAARAREGAARLRLTLPGRLVLGADQTLALGERLFTKPADLRPARAQLKTLRGQTHELHAAIAIIRDGAILFEHRAIARLTMRAFSDGFLDAYLGRSRRRGDRERRRLSGGEASASTCSSASKATISPSSACRCCRCLTFCGGTDGWRHEH